VAAARRRVAARGDRGGAGDAAGGKPRDDTGSVSARVIALDALLRVEDGAYAHVVVPAMLGASSLSSRDRAFATDLVYGTVRAQRRIDDLLAHVVTRPVARLDPPVRAALRMGAYQLLRGLPAHAAVGETVQALGARSPRAKGFANANLRSLTRIGPPWPEPEAVAVALSYPDWLVERLTRDLGADAAKRSLAAMNEPAAVTLRPNVRVATGAALVEELRQQLAPPAAERERGAPRGARGESRGGARGESRGGSGGGPPAGAEVSSGTLVADAVRVRGVGDPGRLAAVAEGRATPQDEGSQAVVTALAPAPGERIADLAAAPGGKATAIGERVGPGGCVVALDLDAGRSRLVAEAADRLELPWLQVGVGDARRPPLRPGTFDRVLLDAPCSGIGVLRRRADARWRLTPEVIAECAALQRELVLAAAPLLRPGGLLVYSVCTLTPEETIGVDEFAAAQLPGFVAEAPPRRPWRAHGRGALLLPYERGTDGMFVLLLRAPILAG
jgi:16S rRNA (cytosine967-C5)-methyltransferase